MQDARLSTSLPRICIKCNMRQLSPSAGIMGHFGTYGLGESEANHLGCQASRTLVLG
jgi:hypothetical protein